MASSNFLCRLDRLSSLPLSLTVDRRFCATAAAQPWRQPERAFSNLLHYCAHSGFLSFEMRGEGILSVHSGDKREAFRFRHGQSPGPKPPPLATDTCKIAGIMNKVADVIVWTTRNRNYKTVHYLCYTFSMPELYVTVTFVQESIRRIHRYLTNQ